MGAGPGDPAGSGAPAGRASPPMLESLAAFVDLVDDLRRGCPWDAEQTHASLRPHLLEEAHELLEALDALEALESGDAPGDHLAGALAHVQEELGDLLFQVVFHSRIAVESGHFDLGDVAQGIHDKLHHRHPHVFGDTEVDGPDEVVANWDRIKQAEKGRTSVLDGIPPTLPALARAAKTLRRASAAGLAPEPPASGPVDAEALGEALLGLVAWAGAAGLDPEEALREAVARLGTRIRDAEGREPSDG